MKPAEILKNCIYRENRKHFSSEPWDMLNLEVVNC